MGGFDSVDYRHSGQSSAEICTKQHFLLRQLIGGSRTSAAPIASRLLSKFGTISDVLSASADALTRIVEDHTIVACLLAAKPTVLKDLGDRVRRTPFDLRDVALQHWIVSLFKGYRRERIHIALLDRDKHLVCDELLNDGELGSVEGNLRQIVRSGMGLDASGVVLMHNHPSGNVTPSAADISETRRIAYVLSNLDMRLEDHVIVSERKIFSMKRAELL